MKKNKTIDYKRTIRLWKKHYALTKVAELLDIPYSHLLAGLCKEKNVKNLSELRKKCRIKKPLSQKSNDQLIQAKALYLQMHTYQKVADHMGITRERVRQLLEKGKRAGLYGHETYRGVRYKELIGQYTKERILSAFNEHTKLEKICLALNIEKSDLYKLFQHYQIDLQDCYEAARRNKCLKDYMKIVDALGDHPTTTEMNPIPTWRAVWARIDRYWGTMEKFRKAYGIEKPKFRFNPNTLKSFENNRNKKKQQKEQKTNQILDIVRQKGPIGIKSLCEISGFKRNSVHGYLRSLLTQGIIEQKGEGYNVQYELYGGSTQTTLPLDPKPTN